MSTVNKNKTKEFFNASYQDWQKKIFLTWKILLNWCHKIVCVQFPFSFPQADWRDSRNIIHVTTSVQLNGYWWDFLFLSIKFQMKKFWVFVEFREEAKKNLENNWRKETKEKKNLNKKQWGGRDAVATGRAQWQLIQNDFCD